MPAKKKSKRLCQLEDACRDLNGMLHRSEQEAAFVKTENEKLRKQLAAVSPERMIEARVKLANSIGQMIDAATSAVRFIVAKEVL